MPTAEKEAKLCSKCKENPRTADDSTNPWCTKCLAEYMAEYRKKGEWRAERRGILRGIQAMREHVAAHFGQWAGRPFMGAEVISVVNSLPGPAVADESAVKNA
jgi:hypothetical protein